MTHVIQNCKHHYQPLGYEIIKDTEEIMHVLVIIFCDICSTFRTKILVIDKSQVNNYPKNRG